MVSGGSSRFIPVAMPSGFRQQSVKIMRVFMVTVGTFHAGQLLLIPFAAVSPWIAGGIYAYIGLIGVAMTFRLIRLLKRTPKHTN